jgi:hypothetical protein
VIIVDRRGLKKPLQVFTKTTPGIGHGCLPHIRQHVPDPPQQDHSFTFLGFDFPFALGRGLLALVLRASIAAVVIVFFDDPKRAAGLISNSWPQPQGHFTSMLSPASRIFRRDRTA